MIGFAITRGYTVVVDDIDADLAKLRWYAKFSRNDHYRGAARSIRLPTGQQTVCRLHRVIAERMGLAIEGRHVDHEDLNPSNNRRSNLRTATNGESNRNRGMRRDNSSGFAGVDSQGSKHRASIVFEKQRIHLGLFVYPQHASDIR